MLILREAGVLLGVGLLIGTGLALASTRAAASLLYGLKHYDPLTLGLAAMSLALFPLPQAICRHSAPRAFILQKRCVKSSRRKSLVRKPAQQYRKSSNLLR